ncbi:MAG: hypothetical protein JRI46_00340 [Deltaproteobacteria bacterium]|nr:hypothetical protein [Deltaproteobacteria bacterium]
MSPLTHLEISWFVANIPPGVERFDRGLIVLSGIIADLDGLGIFWGWRFYQRYHHIFLHNFLVAALVGILPLLLPLEHKFLVSILCLTSFHLHIVCDLLGSGPGWPVSYLWPLNRREWYCRYQWNLVSWQNSTITFLMIIPILWIALHYGRTPLEFLSPAMDARLVGFIRTIWPQ